MVAITFAVPTASCDHPFFNTLHLQLPLRQDAPCSLFQHRPSTAFTSFVSTKISAVRKSRDIRMMYRKTSHQACNNRDDERWENGKNDGCDGINSLGEPESDEHRRWKNDAQKRQCQPCNNRRMVLLSSSLAASGIFGLPLSANAAKGAAEYDLEYYIRDLV